MPTFPEPTGHRSTDIVRILRARWEWDIPAEAEGLDEAALAAWMIRMRGAAQLSVFAIKVRQYVCGSADAGYAAMRLNQLTHGIF
jgi:hypothetical protein